MYAAARLDAERSLEFLPKGGREKNQDGVELEPAHDHGEREKNLGVAVKWE